MSGAVEAIYSPEKGMIACVIMQVIFGGDRRPCHYFGAGDWEVNAPDDTFRRMSLTLDQWRQLGMMPREERIAAWNNRQERSHD